MASCADGLFRARMSSSSAHPYCVPLQQRLTSTLNSSVLTALHHTASSTSTVAPQLPAMTSHADSGSVSRLPSRFTEGFPSPANSARCLSIAP